MNLGGGGAQGGTGSDQGADYRNTGGPNANAAAKESPYDVDVEIYGLIYLYNPPQRSKLGLPEEEEAPVGPGAAAQAPAGG